MNYPLKSGITSNAILARELRRKLCFLIGEGTKAAEILANLSDEELIKKDGQHRPHRRAVQSRSNRNIRMSLGA
jgi:hypothetical protein